MGDRGREKKKRDIKQGAEDRRQGAEP